ncbi:MAG: hypothetical protein CMM50_07045 [Rhodospirillaceae bacterium]|nr:hypothetical protein [Rhodospirillaceae bacterium]
MNEGAQGIPDRGPADWSPVGGEAKPPSIEPAQGRPESSSDPTVGVFSYRVGFLALLGTTLLGAAGCGYGLLVGTTFGALSWWEWITVPTMGVICGAFALVLLVTGERHLKRIAVGVIVWLSFYLLSNTANALYFLPEKLTAFVYLPWMMVLYGFMAAVLSARAGIRAAWAVFLGVVAIAVPLIVSDPEWRPGVEAGDALMINMFAQAAFIAMLYAMSTFRERHAATEARAEALAESAAKLARMAFHDVLTGLPNRSLVEDRLTKAMASAERAGEGVAVHYIDLDHFKDVNDTLGHAAGDKMLQEVARRLLALVRKTDTVGRMGGDEFVIVQPALHSAHDVTALGRRILATLAQPVTVASTALAPGASVGTTSYHYPAPLAPGSKADPEAAPPQKYPADLLSEADAALFAAKSAGRNMQRMFEPAMLEEADKRVRLRSALHRAIEKQEFVLHFQPQVDLRNNTLVAAEALIRWEDPEHGLRGPGDFIGALEASGEIVAVGNWVIQRACLAAAGWQDNSIRVAVNVSPVQLERGDLVSMVRSALIESGLRPDRLELEITENVLARAQEARIREVMRELSELGVRLAVDDFGTGYSSLLYLLEFPVDTLKIDRAFLAQIDSRSVDRAIVKAIIAFARSINIDVVAEGIERDAQTEYLLQESCWYGQGFHLARPMTHAQLVERYRLQQFWEEAS